VVTAAVAAAVVTVAATMLAAQPRIPVAAAPMPNRVMTMVFIVQVMTTGFIARATIADCMPAVNRGMTSA
jgi:hypothetical protein